LNKGAGDTGALGLLIFWGLVAFGIWFFVWGRDTSLRYQIQYSASSENVTVEKKPTDCEFLHAPMGNKDCHYEKAVGVVTYAPDTQTGRPIVSYDDGKHWAWNDGGPLTGARVYVSWRKETD
jgi:hypothetical protein